MVFLLACGVSQSVEDSAKQDVFSPKSESVEIELGAGQELRWLFEGAAELEDVSGDGLLGIEIIYGTAQADSQVDVTLFDGNSIETVLFEEQLVSESGARYQEQIPCSPTCSFRYISKAIHSGGAENTLLKLIFRLDQPEGDLLISPLQ